ncbi:tetratricopeptide repeat protein [Polynucleobacter sp. MWH-Creno-3A4]|uniref:tetratricopeptide repeat protein n=1 Tax=Polynucleobacter sp. MWH-Creno-3A4 TaxID=1855886 RepID=UPI001C0C9858|nr:tetratricopeptide repeat protein [Polynucleobacter sp. MWH-Creno-3A4]MBU3605579.1 tetratricopeptide repeat protein [Polynucleobacter sp. MWH-Creno-3A4]
MNPQLQIMLQQGIQAFQSGNFEGANSILKRIIEVDSKNLPALHVLGLIQASQKKYKEAAELLSRAARINPNDASIQYNLAKAMVDCGLEKESLPHHKKAVELMPNNPEAWLNYGKTTSNLGNDEQAIFCYDKALSFNPDYAEAYLNKGAALKKIGQYEEAILSSEKALKINPNLAEAWTNKGNVLYELKRYDEALIYYERALMLNPASHKAWAYKGLALQEIEHYDASLIHFDEAIKLKPDYHEAWVNRGVVFHLLERFGDALISFDAALNIDYSNPNAWINRGITLQELKKFEDALIHYDEALKLNQNDCTAWFNKGVALLELKRLDQALSHFDQALSINPKFADASFNKSIALLLQGDFENGLQLYESRWESEKVSRIAGKRNLTQPLWIGSQPLQNKTILLYDEQGFGDLIQFSRYAKLVSDLGARVILEVPGPLAQLFSGLEGVAQLVIKGEELPDFDYQCPLLSLPFALKTEVENIPASQSYLVSDPNKVAKWKLKLGEGKNKRIGVAWSSTSAFKGDSKRSLLLEDFVKALPTEGYEYICLQKELKDCDKEFLHSYKNIKFFGDDLEDFSETAALIECVDLVISTCTSIPHLSAALGKETWVLLSYVPDWRWLLEREDSPWYPSIKLCRQQALGDWDNLLKRVNLDLSSAHI